MVNILGLDFDPSSLFGNILGGGQTPDAGTTTPTQTGDATSSLYSNLMGGDSALAKQLAAARFQQGLMGLGAGLMKGGAPSLLPVSFGTAAASGMEGLMNAQNNVMTQGLQAAQTGDSLAQAQLRKMQGAQLAGQIQNLKEFGEDKEFSQYLKPGGSTTTGTTQPTQPIPLTPVGQPTGDMKIGGALPSGGVSLLKSTAEQAAASVLPPGYRYVVTSDYRPGATVAGTGGKSQHSIPGGAVDGQIIGPNGPIPNTGEDTTGLYGQVAMATRGMLPPSLAGQLGWGGNFPTGKGEKDLMHLDLGGDRGRYGSLAQMAARGGMPQLPAAAVPNQPAVPGQASNEMLRMGSGQQIPPAVAQRMALKLALSGPVGQQMYEALGLKNILGMPTAVEQARQIAANQANIDVAKAGPMEAAKTTANLQSRLKYEPTLTGANKGAETQALQNAQLGRPGATQADVEAAKQSATTKALQDAQFGSPGATQADVLGAGKGAETTADLNARLGIEPQLKGRLTTAEEIARTTYGTHTMVPMQVDLGTPDRPNPKTISVPQNYAQFGARGVQAYLNGQPVPTGLLPPAPAPGAGPAAPGPGPAGPGALPPAPGPAPGPLSPDAPAPNLPVLGGPPVNPIHEAAVKDQMTHENEVILKPAYTAHENARQQIQISDMIQDLKKDVTLGVGSEVRQKAAKILAAMGVSNETIKEVSGMDPAKGDAIVKFFLQQSAGAVRDMGAKEPGSVIDLFRKAYSNLETHPHAVDILENVLKMQAIYSQRHYDALAGFKASQITDLGNNKPFQSMHQYNAQWTGNPNNSPENYLTAASIMAGEFGRFNKLKPEQRQQVIGLIPSGTTISDGKNTWTTP